MNLPKNQNFIFLIKSSSKSGSKVKIKNFISQIIFETSHDYKKMLKRKRSFFILMLAHFKLHLLKCILQISLNRGPNSRFIIEVNNKVLWPKSSQSWTLVTQTLAHTNHNHKPISKLPEYHHAYTNTNLCNDLFLSDYKFIRVCIKNYPINKL